MRSKYYPDFHNVQKAMAVSVALCAYFSLAPSTQAIPTLTLSSGGTSQTVADADDGAADGIVQFYGSVGAFDLNFTLGVTKPAFGSAADPWMDVVSLDANTINTGGTLKLTFEDTDFTGSPLIMQTGVGGTTDGSVIFNTYVNGVLFSTSGNLSGPTFTSLTTGILNAPAPYSLKIEAIITHTGGGQMTGFDAEFKSLGTPVPDGGATAVLAGLSLLGMAGCGRLFRKN
jgi:hypothetical protein